MLNAEKILKLAEQENYIEIIEICKKEIISNETKKSGGMSLEKSRKAFNRYLKTNQKRCILEFTKDLENDEQ